MNLSELNRNFITQQISNLADLFKTPPGNKYQDFGPLLEAGAKYVQARGMDQHILNVLLVQPLELLAKHEPPEDIGDIVNQLLHRLKA